MMCLKSLTHVLIYAIMICSSMCFSNLIVAQNPVYTIPTVVHIIHTDSTYTNISDNQVYSAIDALNDDFRKIAGTIGDGLGVDTEIEFCLAQRTPWGTATNGINRVNCSGNCALGYDTLGLDPDVNEYAVKSLSQWDEKDYFNIWVVHKLAGSLQNESGFARKPSENFNPVIDGAVVLYSAFGKGSQFQNLDPTTSLNRTITHLSGHYLNLYDTYEGDSNGTQCPINQHCSADGDRCCDTPPHIRSNNTCVVNSNCGAQAPIKNYMDNSSESCKNEFTSDQKLRMRNNLEFQRLSLVNSLGCEAPCSDIIASFTYDPKEGVMPVTVQFHSDIQSNNSNLTYEWYINEVFFSSDSDPNLVIEQHACDEVCLVVSTSDCTVEICEVVVVFPETTIQPCACPTGDIDFVHNGLLADANTPACEDLSPILNWTEYKDKTPWYCPLEGDKVALAGNYKDQWNFGSSDGEFIISEYPIELPAGKYEVSFLYSVQKKLDGTSGDPNSMNVQMVLLKDTQNSGGSFTSIASAQNVSFDYPSSAGFHTDTDYFCYPSHYEASNPDLNLDVIWHPMKRTFYQVNPITAQDSVYLLLGGFSNNDNTNTIYFKNCCISSCVSECESVYNFDYTINGCEVRFNSTAGTPSLETPDFTWNFGDGSPLGSGADAIHTFNWGGTFEVCMTYSCGGNSRTVCQEIYIEENSGCDSCIQVAGDNTAKQCSETGKYIGEFNMQIPPGFTICAEDEQAIWVENGDVSVTSIFIDNDVNMLYLSYEIKPNDPEFIDAIPFKLTLCSPTGKAVCFDYVDGIRGSQCESCETNIIETLASCDARNNGEAPYIYTGSLAIPGGLVLCGTPSVISDNAGFSVNSVTSTSIDFTIKTQKENPFIVTGLIEVCVMENNEKVNKCFPFRIVVSEICPIKKDKARTSNRGFDHKEYYGNYMTIVNNPVDDYLLLEFDSPLVSGDRLEVYSLDGQLKLYRPLEGSEMRFTLDVSSFQSGLYIINFVDSNGLNQSRKVMIVD